MDFQTAFAAGRDPIIFAEMVLGVKLNSAQRRWFLTACATEGGWKWEFRRSVHNAANQIGKTLGLAMSIMWAANYKIGIPNDNWDNWLNSAYNWYHLAPTYTQSTYILNDMKMLSQGKHPAQYDKDKGEFREVLWQENLVMERKIDSTYHALQFWNGSIVHIRTSNDKAKSIQGVRAHGISFDEAAFEDHLLVVMNEALKLRLISTGGPLWLVSTPNGMNDYYQVVQEILNNSMEVEERRWENKVRRTALVWSHISDNVGYGFSAEDASFMEIDVDAETKEQQLRGAFLEPRDAFFTPASAIEPSFANIPDEVPPQNDHKYIIFWDISLKNDATVCVVIDVTNKPHRGVYYRHWAKPMAFRELISEMNRIHDYYNSYDNRRGGKPAVAITGFDASSMGGVAVTQELGIRNSMPLNMSGSARLKTEMLINLRTYLSTNRLVVPKTWIQLKQEIFSYRREDEKIKQDSVMALTGAVRIAQLHYGDAAGRSAKFTMRPRSQKRQVFLR